MNSYLFKLTNLKQLNKIRKELDAGNVMIISICGSLNQQEAVKEIKKISEEIKGDIAWFGEKKVMLTPANTKIDRSKKKDSPLIELSKDPNLIIPKKYDKK